MRRKRTQVCDFVLRFRGPDDAFGELLDDSEIHIPCFSKFDKLNISLSCHTSTPTVGLEQPPETLLLDSSFFPLLLQSTPTFPSA